MSTATTRKHKTLDMVYIAMFAVLIAICSWISIPTAVPFTLQTFGIFVSVRILGGKRGTLAVLIYLLLGVIGIPVFAGFSGGVGVIVGPTGGYLIGFLLSALLMWGLEKVLGKKDWALVLSMVLGLVVCYGFGTIWFMAVYARNVGEIGLMTALGWCVFPFIIPDIIKIVMALIVSKTIIRVIRI